MKSTRRSFLSAALGSPLMYAVGCKSCRPPTGKLVVVFHGTYVFSFDSSKPENERLTAIAPSVPQHVYKAGNFTQETNLSTGTYHLNVDSGGAPTPDNKKFSVVQRANTGNPAETNIIFKMPIPDKFRGLVRLTPKDAAGNKIDLFEDGTTKSQNNVKPDDLPMVYVLTFSIRSIATPTLLDSISAIKWSYQERHLHIIAEPQVDPGPSHSHADAALNAINALFTPILDLQFNHNLADTPAVITPDPDGEVTEDEQKPLYRRFGGLASSIRNCQSLIVCC
jgi:hypothetical protein